MSTIPLQLFFKIFIQGTQITASVMEIGEKVWEAFWVNLPISNTKINLPLSTMMSNSPLLRGWSLYEMHALKQPFFLKVSLIRTWHWGLFNDTDVM